MSKLKSISCFCLLAALTVLGPGQSAAASKTEPIPADDVQVLASGPIHEAFAETVALDPEPGIIVTKAPPALIEEVPPNQKPEGKVQWIPGYWGWDEEREEYIWISGIWRVPPPNLQWVPGYWTPAANGYQWVSGYWTSVKDEVTEYLPEPPESVEIGPSSNAPSPDYIWIPGCWIWHYGRYAWRPGYWAPAHSDWVWVPAHYNWTPRGYIFVNGYWDFTVIHRGILFAPVFFPPRIHLGMTFTFTPAFIINLSVFDDALFLYPRYCHYYYGDYYAPRYYKKGIYPWFSLHARRVVYDPIYAHQRWNHRKDRDWDNRLQAKFRERRDQEGARSHGGFDQRTGPDKVARPSGRPWPDFIMPMNHAKKTRDNAYRFQPLNERERKEFTQREKEVRNYQKERQIRETRTLNKMEGKKPNKTEPYREKFSRPPIMSKPESVKDHRIQENRAQNKLEENAPNRPEPSKEKFPRSPIIDKSVSGRNGKKPPAQFKAPKPNPDVEPLQRENDLSRSWDRSQPSGDREQKPGTGSRQMMNRARESEIRRGPMENRMQPSNDRQRTEYNGAAR